MKKTLTSLLFVLMLSVAVKAQTGWATKNIDENLSVKFPVEPEKTTNKGVDVYIYKAKDSLAYSAAVIDYKVAVHLDSAALAPVKDDQRFADQMKMGIASAKKNYTFGAITIGQWKTYTTYSMTANENTTKNTLFMQMVLISSKMYTLSCRVPAGMVTKNNEVFFGSVELLKK